MVNVDIPGKSFRNLIFKTAHSVTPHLKEITAHSGSERSSMDTSRGEQDVLLYLFKGALLGLSRFLATESPLRMIKIAFYFATKALFVLKIFKFLS